MYKFSYRIRNRINPCCILTEKYSNQIVDGAITNMNSKQVNETVNKLVSFMQDVKDGNLRTILENMQKMNDYMAEKLRIYEEHLTLLTGRARLELTDSDKRRLAWKAKI